MPPSQKHESPTLGDLMSTNKMWQPSSRVIRSTLPSSKFPPPEYGSTETYLLPGSAAVRLNERTYVVTLGERGAKPTCELPPHPRQKARNREARRWGCRPRPAADPTSPRPSRPSWRLPRPRHQIGGLTAARYSRESVGPARDAAKAPGAAPPEEEGRGGGRRPRLSPPRAPQQPPRTTSSPGAHPAAGTGCSFAPVPPPPAPALTFPSLPPPTPAAPGAGT
ncbi:basic proline-rich protein-like [Canis lupus familiaris]|uniref:basic proline-rich protein-like n=1 Tax=Canis lupus familiaris TaxID=9615 RepID=UPI0018F4838B|nr:basic proline-rich protein-like [Canis lupus familiaris]